ncbi:MAG: HAMP domain-containing sensor histidine kinase [Deltaproteobacteria bacterium]
MSSAPKADRRRPWRSLAFRVNAWYVVVFVASIAALVATAVPTVRRALDRADTIVVEDRVERHVAVLSTGLPEYRAAVAHADALGDPEVPVRIRGAHGETLYEHGDVATAHITAMRSTGDLHVEVGAPVDPWTTVFHELRTSALLLALGALVLAVGGGYVLTRRGLRPVRELAATARDVIRSGDLSRRVPEHRSTDELDEVSTLFNRVLAHNEALVAGMRASLDNAAHDLRTPLTRLRGTAEVALRTDDPAAARDALALCIEQSDQLLAMLRMLLDIAEAESGIMKLDLQPVALDRIAQDVVELYGHVADDQGIQLELVTSGVTVRADPARLRQAVANLVDNSVKYTSRGGTVTIETDRQGDTGIVRVRDSGEGIPAEALPRIWDRLYRAEPSRSRPGLGLGLSLVKAIVDAHHGHVEAASPPGGGSTFTISLPLARTSNQDPDR